MRTFKQLFESYFDACYSKSQIPLQQKAEIRQAFYSGAVAVLAEITTRIEQSESSAEESLCRIVKELGDYGDKRSAELDRNS